jgi:ABC-type cobalamin transport system ATPase subunit
MAWAGKFQRWQGKPVKARSPRELPPAAEVQLEPVASLQDAVGAATRDTLAARDAVATANMSACRVGVMLIQAAAAHRGVKWREFLSENKIAPADAKRFMSLARAVQSGVALNHRQLTLSGIVEVRKPGVKKHKRNNASGGEWVRATSTIFSWWNQAIRQRPLREWSIEERDAVRMMFKPVADIARQIG